ncbi:DUF58 domain-containing protein [Bifidobacterium gallicum]|uniref:DUF58 domain-containing protein n=1 Tax=Bifidobacterium gallicum DSM 20093 = LMG 11596 TaxID=561180 RepID=D1NU78_9BIFI|nr:DUF58 domain-containing protein [Bifidobacterium gallicum]EFA23282.1 hypothetical protein BIFGAL_03399 [Bifidobacterium gallicum DSM 20093 = LMG 11596]KFI58926.1 hypothetical protein BGLCM_1223 [Bifidobacterium gallicum DSM 20093 = LMG 11596]
MIKAASTGHGARAQAHSAEDAGAQASRIVRRRIDALASSLTLPTVRKALGVIEGEHVSQRRGGTDDLMDVRAYEAGDEARAIDWKISARHGRPMLVQRERNASSRVVMLMDIGAPMNATCPSGERAWQVAANALCMVAALSLRRSDEVSLVFGDAKSITRMPFHGGLPQFERVLDDALDRDWHESRNIDALLDFASHVRDRHCLLVLATDDHALTHEQHVNLRRIARTHPLMIIDVGTINPFDAQPVASKPSVPIVDGRSGRRIPAFLRSAANAKEVATHRSFLIHELKQQLTAVGATLVHAASSDAMFHALVKIIASAQPHHVGGVSLLPGASAVRSHAQSGASARTVKEGARLS